MDIKIKYQAFTPPPPPPPPTTHPFVGYKEKTVEYHIDHISLANHRLKSRHISQEQSPQYNWRFCDSENSNTNRSMYLMRKIFSVTMATEACSSKEIPILDMFNQYLSNATMVSWAYRDSCQCRQCFGYVRL